MSGRGAGIYTIRVTATDRAGNLARQQIRVRYFVRSPGDVNGDGKIDVSDAILLLQVAVGLPTALDLAAGDVAPSPGTNGRLYGDGRVTVADAVRILRHALNLDQSPWP